MHQSPIAIVGLAGRFPDADNVEQFWANLVDGVESVGRSARVKPPEAPGAGHWVELDAPNDHNELFDPGFFGLTPKEAGQLEPQQRNFLEVCWHAFEDGGYVIGPRTQRVGVFAGANFTSYFGLTPSSYLPDALPEMIGADKDYLATRVSHHFGLSGPAFTVQSACSTSLVAVHLACQSLRANECDAALAGGASITIPRLTRYFYTPGAILSPDGYCRAFDAKARGTVFTEGAAAVLLMRLADAVAGGHQIYAVIRGSAVNNDGGGKASYMAPSIHGQERVVSAALEAAGVRASEVGYVEAHGTATVIGDAIELAALTRVFARDGARPGTCRIGSVKTNIGHLASAAGVAGLIKTALALRHGTIPASLNHDEPNPDLDLATSPFVVCSRPVPWPVSEKRRIAGVSSFGVGGTNAHVILEGFDADASSEAANRGAYVVAVSGHSETALACGREALRERLVDADRAALADIAFTACTGRAALAFRSAVVCTDADDARRRLAQTAAVATRAGAERRVGWVFPGQGSQYVGMGAGLFQAEPVFREAVETCFDRLERTGGPDLRRLFRPDAHEAIAEGALQDTSLAQPALFATEYALARLYESWGLQPAGLIGHSLGEYAAVCLAGCLDLGDALRLVQLRGALMQALPRGGMLAVAAAPERVRQVLPEDLDLAAVNAPRLCVVAGPAAAIDAFQAQLADLRIAATRLKTSHAFHSRMMDPMLKAFGEATRGLQVHPPRFPIVSSLSGERLDETALGDPEYWVRHIREPVQFAAGVQRLVDQGVDVLVEMGPGRALTGLARQAGVDRQGVSLFATMPEDRQPRSEAGSALECAARLWEVGAKLDLGATFAGERRRLSALPSYPFQRQRFPYVSANGADPRRAAGRRDLEDWFFAPGWERAQLSPAEPPAEPAKEGCWLLMRTRACPLADNLAERLEREGARVISLYPGDEPELAPEAMTVRPSDPADYERAFQAIAERGLRPERIVHLWTLQDDQGSVATGAFGRLQDRGLSSLICVGGAFEKAFGGADLQVEIVSAGLFDVLGDELILPHNAPLLAFANVAPQEQLRMNCRVVDLAADRPAGEAAAEALIEAFKSGPVRSLALRNGRWWRPRMHHLPAAGARPPIGAGDVVILFGGLGQISRTIGEHLVRDHGARLVLVGRGALAGPHDLHQDDDEAALRRRYVATLEELGAEYLYVAADVTNPAEVQGVREQALARFGRVDGVVFAAGKMGLAGPATAVSTLADYPDFFGPKVHGLANVMAAFEADNLKYGMVLSSISTVLGGLGHCAYAAANHAADALVLKAARQRSPWRTVNWDLWQAPDRNSSAPSAELSRYAIRPAEGGAAFEAALSFPSCVQLVVSTHDLAQRIDQWIERRGMGDFAPKSGVRHDRPVLASSFAAPEGRLEADLAEIWQEVLGVAAVGRDDDFFELGGHSLLAVQAANLIQKTMAGAALTPNLYETPTIRLLAESLQPQMRPQALEPAQ